MFTSHCSSTRPSSRAAAGAQPGQAGRPSATRFSFPGRFTTDTAPMTATTTIPLCSSAPLGASWSAPLGALGAVVRLGGSFVGAGATVGARDRHAPPRYAKGLEQGFEKQVDRQRQLQRGRENVGAEIGRGGGTP